MPLQVTCSTCRHRQEFDESLAGKIVDCAGCGEPVRVPTLPDKVEKCPNCFVPIEDGAVVCMQCGYNRETGTFLNTVVEKEEELLPFWHRTLNVVADLVPGLFNLKILICSIFCFAAAVTLLILGFGLLAFAFLEPILIAAFGLVCYAQGLAMLLSGTLQVLSRAMNDFETPHWWIFCIMVFGPFAAMLLAFSLLAPAT